MRGTDTGLVFTMRGTKKFLDRTHGPLAHADDLHPSTTLLGDWYATVLFWKPHVALFVNEPTRLPLFVPLAPVATVIARLPRTAAEVFARLGLDQQVIDAEVTQMGAYQLAKTASRSVLGTMNDFAYLAGAHRDTNHGVDLIELALRLAGTPCGPLYPSHVSPDREIIAYLNQHRR